MPCSHKIDIDTYTDYQEKCEQNTETLHFAQKSTQVLMIIQWKNGALL